MKHIVIIIYRLGVGGAERLIVDEIRELTTRGHYVHLITLAREKHASLMSEVTAATQLDTVLFRGVWDLRAVYALAQTLKRVHPDVVMTHLWFANTVGRFAAWLARLPVITFEHNVYDRVKTSKQFWIDRLLQSLSTHIVAVSPTVRDSLVDHGIDAARIVVIHNGIDVSRFSSPAHDSHTPFVFIFIGRLIEQKGVDTLLEACAHVPDAVLLIAGDGLLRDPLETHAKRLHLDERVRFLGIQRDIPALLRSADCFVFPSRWEGFGLTLVEAAAAGLPIVASDLPVVRDLMPQHALLVPAGDAIALAVAMQRMVDDTELRTAMARASLERSKAFSIEAHVDNLLKIIS